MVTTSTQRVEYDGTYRIDSVGKTGHKVVIYTKGYKLKSWLDFEKSVGCVAEFVPVSEEEFEAHQWYNTPFEEEEKPAAKKAVKKPAAKKAAPAKKAAKKAVKKTAKKATTSKAGKKNAKGK